MKAISAILCLFLIGCASQRIPVQPGVIPSQDSVLEQDEQYGHQVMATLTERYPLSRDDQQINRVREIVDKITVAARADKNPWHVYVLQGDDFENAAATRGNFVFVWTGMLSKINNDDELANLLAHEIGHVLAGHVHPDPSEEANQILTGMIKELTQEIMIHQGGAAAGLAGLAGVLIYNTLNGFFVNPDIKRREYEADHIGLFLMADAGFDPEKGIQFWDRAANDPGLSDGALQFFSTHPPSFERLEQLKSFLPEALRRYQMAKSGNPYRGSIQSRINQYSSSLQSEEWEAAEDGIAVYSAPQTSSSVVGYLNRGDRVNIISRLRGWLEVDGPLSGYVKGGTLSPLH